jgi:hypothetical protein
VFVGVGVLVGVGVAVGVLVAVGPIPTISGRLTPSPLHMHARMVNISITKVIKERRLVIIAFFLSSE